MGGAAVESTEALHQEGSRFHWHVLPVAALSGFSDLCSELADVNWPKVAHSLIRYRSVLSNAFTDQKSLPSLHWWGDRVPVCLTMFMWHGPLWLLQQITLIYPCLHSSERPADVWCMDKSPLSLLSSTSDSAQSLSPAHWHLSGNGGFPARLLA